jgi:hypothetical protein
MNHNSTASHWKDDAPWDSNCDTIHRTSATSASSCSISLRFPGLEDLDSLIKADLISVKSPES